MFLFVDRIQELVPGERALGISLVTDCEAFLCADDPGSSDRAAPSVPPCILGEAVGQLAAWTVMAANDFTRRPVGALIDKVEIVGRARRGDPLTLDVRVEPDDDAALRYHGAARVRGSDVFRFGNGFSPLLDTRDFDDPDRLRARFSEIVRYEDGGGPAAAAPPRADYAHARRIDFGCGDVLEHDPGRRIRAERRFALTEPFFSDHFPRKPVVPMTVVMECLLRMARGLLDEGSTEERGAHRITVRGAKINRFIHPGDVLTTTVRRTERGGEGASFHLRGDVAGRRTCQARVDFTPLDA